MPDSIDAYDGALTRAAVHARSWLGSVRSRPVGPRVSADEMRAALGGLVLTARSGPRLVGSVRARVADGVLHVGRLVVAPDRQGRGIGAALLTAVERVAGPEAHTAALFTGHRSAGNLRLYRQAGYVEQRREPVDELLTLVHLRKDLLPPTPRKLGAVPGTGPDPTVVDR